MLRQAVVLGGRAVIPAAMGLALTSPGFALAADPAAVPGVSGTRAPAAAAAAAPVIDSAVHARDPVSRRADVPGHAHGRGAGEAPVTADDAQPQAAPGAGAQAPAPAPPVDSSAPASGTSSLTAQSGFGPPGRIEIADALRVSSPLPVLSIDAARRGLLTVVSGRLGATSALLRVEIALRRGGARRGCAWWVADRARFAPPSRAACGKPRWLRASLHRTAGGWRWQARLRGAVRRAGGDALLVRVLDRHGRPVDVERR